MISDQLASCPNCIFYVKRELSVSECMCMYESQDFCESQECMIEATQGTYALMRKFNFKKITVTKMLYEQNVILLTLFIN